MNTGICVSHKKFYNFKVLSSSSDSDSKTSHLLSAKEGEHWRSPSSKEDFPISIILELDNNQKQWFNTLSIGIDTNTRESWPKSFRFEISDDMISWRVIISEKNFLVATDKEYTWHTPLTNAKYLKLLILEQHKKNNQYFTVIPFLKIGIQGIINIKASSELDRLWTKGNLIDTRPDYGWSSKASQIKESESVQFDLGAINLVNEIRLKSKNQANPCFPQDFILDYSLDGNIWQTIRQEKDFIAQGNTWYSWSFLPRNIRHIRIIINEGGKNEDDHFISQIIEFEAYAIDVHNDHSHPLEGLTPYATTINAGLVRLAKDGETTLNVAVQGNDRRLKDATITSKGIIRLADNGEVSPLAAVQANDKRLREASDTYKGIVQLAKDGDIRPNVVVQGNDKRLKEATEESLGIIKLCPHGDYTERKAVQGNDPRLKNATIQWPGIVQLATDGEDKMNVVVQGNDKRLKTANTERLGIVQLAKDGEVKENLVVQSNDKRLREATGTYKGIVKLAKNNEDKEGVVIQGNDDRLKKASENAFGIIRLAKHSEKISGLAVQANDPRLYDDRKPLRHEHPYAPLNHEFNDHVGHLWIEGSKATQLFDTSPPPSNKSLIGAKIIRGKRDKVEAGSSLIAVMGSCSEKPEANEKIIGVLGHSYNTGVRGQSLGIKENGMNLGSGVEGHGRDCPGGRFFSRHDYALIAGSKSMEDGNPSSGKALLVEGDSKFNGKILLKSNNPFTENVLAYKIKADFEEPLSPGDLVSIHNEKSLTVRKSNQAYDTNVMGVVVLQPAIEISAETEIGGAQIAILGIVKAKVDPSFGEIKPGDLLTTSKTPGHAMKANITDLKQTGSIIGKALEAAKSNTKEIKILLTRF